MYQQPKPIYSVPRDDNSATSGPIYIILDKGMVVIDTLLEPILVVPPSVVPRWCHLFRSQLVHSVTLFSSCPIDFILGRVLEVNDTF